MGRFYWLFFIWLFVGFGSLAENGTRGFYGGARAGTMTPMTTQAEANSRTADWRLPAEWEAQDGVLLAWPQPEMDWRPYLADARRTVAAIAAAITRYEQLVLIARGAGASDALGAADFRRLPARRHLGA